jgi:hypothetical protein
MAGMKSSLSRIDRFLLPRWRVSALGLPFDSARFA